jgi:hypothetical protein
LQLISETDGFQLRRTNQERYLMNLQAKFLGDAGLYKYGKNNPQSQLSSYVDFIAPHVSADTQSHHEAKRY